MPKRLPCLLALGLLSLGLPACDSGSPTDTDWTARLNLFPADGAVLTTDFNLDIGTAFVDSMVVQVDGVRLGSVTARPFVWPVALVDHGHGYHTLAVDVFAKGEQERLTAEVLVCHGLGLAVGNFAPTFSLPDRDGVPRSPVAGTSTRAVLLDFWASWCLPCVAALPETQRLSDQYGEQGLQVLTINAEDKDLVESFMLENAYDFTVLHDEAGRVNRLFGVDAIPKYYILDHRGVVRYVRLGGGGSPLEEFIVPLLQNGRGELSPGF